MGDDLGAQLTRLAERIISDVENSAIDIRIDALKACTTLHLGLAKIAGKVPEDEPTGPGMNEWKRAIKGERADA